VETHSIPTFGSHGSFLNEMKSPNSERKLVLEAAIESEMGET